MEIIKDENGQDIQIVRDEKGQVIARIHGELNTDLIAEFFVKNAKATTNGNS